MKTKIHKNKILRLNEICKMMKVIYLIMKFMFK